MTQPYTEEARLADVIRRLAEVHRVPIAHTDGVSDALKAVLRSFGLPFTHDEGRDDLLALLLGYLLFPKSNQSF